MAQAIGDPEELERFAYSLQQFIDSLNDAVGNLNGAFASLGDTWQDEKRARFEEDYNALVDRKSTRLNSSHLKLSRMPSSA